MNADTALQTEVGSLCDALQAEPLFHFSLSSKEVFHSNFLAWFADRFPGEAASAFAPWGTALPGGAGNPSEREPAHLDLVLHLPGLAPLAIENKVFSVPDENQLERLGQGAVAQRDLAGPQYGRLLLSLMSPGWTEYEGWRLVSYRELASALEPCTPRVRAADHFAGDLLEHYVVLIRLLVDLLDLLGQPDPDGPLLLPSPIMAHLDRARVSAAVQKARGSYIARDLLRAVTAKGWTTTEIDHGFTRGMSLLEGYRRRAPKEGNPAQDALGWQLQGPQFRLAVVTSDFGGGAHREQRERYVTERYADWFDFSLVEKIAGVSATSHATEVRGGRWHFQGYNPDFVYRYCVAPELTPSQVLELGLLYLDRAGQFLEPPHSVHQGIPTPGILAATSR